MIKSKNTYGQLLHKVFNQEMKHGCELVITGLAAMPSCGKIMEGSTIMVAIQLSKIINAYKINKTSTK